MNTTFKKVTSSVLTLWVVLTTITPWLSFAETKSFKDVPVSDTGYSAIMSLSEKGVISGHSDGTYKPNDSLSKVEALKILLNVTSKSTIEGNAGLKTATTVYKDVDSNQWYTPFVNFSKTQGILDTNIENTSNNLGKDDKITRAEFIQLFVNSFGVKLSSEADAIKWTKFADIKYNPNYHWAAPAAYAMETYLKYVNGYSATQFGPGNTITRREVAVIMDRYFTKPENFKNVELKSTSSAILDSSVLTLLKDKGTVISTSVTTDTTGTGSLDLSSLLNDTTTTPATTTPVVPSTTTPTTTTTPVSTTGTDTITISQSSDNVISGAMPLKVTKVKVIGLTFVNNKTKDVEVNEVKAYVSWLGDKTLVDWMYFTDSNGVTLGTKRSIVQNIDTSKSGVDFIFSPNAFVIPKSSTLKVYLNIDLKSTITNGQNYQFSIDDIKLTDSTNVLTGLTLPYKSSAVYTVWVATSTVTVTNPDSSSLDARVGEDNILLSQFNLEADNVGSVKLHTIKFENGGTSDLNTSLSNLKIKVGWVDTPATPTIKGRYLYFTLTTDMVIAKNSSTSVEVYSTLKWDINRSIQLFLPSDSLYILDTNSFGCQTILTNLDSSSKGKTINIKGSKISFSNTTLTTTDTNSNVTKFVLFNSNLVLSEGVNFNNFKLGVISQTSGMTQVQRENEVLNYLENVTLQTTKDDGTVNSYTASTTLWTLAFGQLFNFTDVNLLPGTYKVQLYADIKVAAPQNTQFQAKFDSTNISGSYATSNNNITTNDFSVGTLQGQVVTIAKPTATFTKVSLNPTTIVWGTMWLELYKFQIKANNTDDLKVSNVSVKYSGTNFSDIFDRVYLYSGTTKLAEVSSLGSNVIVFNSVNSSVLKNQTNEYVIKGDVKSSVAANTSFSLSLNDETYLVVRDSKNSLLATANKTGLTSIQTGPTYSVLSSGLAKVESLFDESTFSQNKYVVGNSTETIVWRLKVNPKYENETLKKIVLKNLGSAGVNDINYVSLYSSNLLSPDTYIWRGNISSDGKVIISGLNTKFVKDQITYIYIVVNFKNIGDVGGETGTSGRTVQLAVMDYQLLGESSSLTIRPIYVQGDTNSLITTTIDVEGAANTLKLGFAAGSPTSAQLASTKVYINWDMYSFSISATDVPTKNIQVAALGTNATTIITDLNTVVWNVVNSGTFYTTATADAGLSLALTNTTSTSTKTFTYYPSFITWITSSDTISPTISFGGNINLGGIKVSAATQTNHNNNDVVYATIDQLHLQASHNLDGAGGVSISNLYIERVWGTFPKQALVLWDTVATTKQLYNFDGTTIATNAALNTSLVSANGITLKNLKTLLGVDAKIAPGATAEFRISGTLSTVTTATRYFQFTLKEIRTPASATEGFQWKTNYSDVSNIVWLNNSDIVQDLSLTNLKN